MFSLTDINKMDINRIKKRQINIDSIPNRFEQLVPTVTEHLVVLLVTETNIDCSFPDTRFPMTIQVHAGQTKTIREVVFYSK